MERTYSNPVSRSFFVALMAMVVMLWLVVPASARRVENASTSGYQLEVSHHVDNADMSIHLDAGIADAGDWQSAWIDYSSTSVCGSPGGMDLYTHFSIQGQLDDGDLGAVLDVDPTKGKNKLMSGYGEVDGTFQWTFYNQCDTGDVFEGESEATMTIDLEGFGKVGKTTSSDSFHLPGEVNENNKFQATFRQATGSIDIAWESEDNPPFNRYLEVDGRIAAVTWSSHHNSK